MKTTVRKAYVVVGSEAQRVLANSRGEVYTHAAGWTKPAGVVLSEGPVYERWMDVPEAWLGHVAWWN
jgi:hypothetical protein